MIIIIINNIIRESRKKRYFLFLLRESFERIFSYQSSLNANIWYNKDNKHCCRYLHIKTSTGFPKQTTNRNKYCFILWNINNNNQVHFLPSLCVMKTNTWLISWLYCKVGLKKACFRESVEIILLEFIYIEKFFVFENHTNILSRRIEENKTQLIMSSTSFYRTYSSPNLRGKCW